MAAEQRNGFFRHNTLLISDVSFPFREHCFGETVARFPSCVGGAVFMLFSLFSLILSFLLSRVGTVFAVAHDRPSKRYSLLYKNQCLINPGCLSVVVLSFIPGSASH